MAKDNKEPKKVIYVGKGDSYRRDFGNGREIELPKGVVVPVGDHMFDILKDCRDVHPVKGQSRTLVGDFRNFREKMIKE
jgi:hypothetical protein